VLLLLPKEPLIRATRYARVGSRTANPPCRGTNRRAFHNLPESLTRGGLSDSWLPLEPSQSVTNEFFLSASALSALAEPLRFSYRPQPKAERLISLYPMKREVIVDERNTIFQLACNAIEALLTTGDIVDVEATAARILARFPRCGLTAEELTEIVAKAAKKLGAAIYAAT
jgi:hypothetical protein